MTAELVVALTTRLMEDAQPIGGKLWKYLRTVGDTDICDWALKHFSSADARKVRDCLDRVPKIAKTLGELREIGIEAITEFDRLYPKQFNITLQNNRPPVLFVAGNHRLLQSECIGVVGSRNVDESGGEFAELLGQTIACAGLTLVSGGAKGVDSIASRAAVRAGGNSISFIADSLAKIVCNPTEAAAIESGRVCFASPASPYAPFSVALRMARNKLIYAISRATVVVSSAQNVGGTWAGATAALKKRMCLLLVRQADNAPPGNAALIAKGGIPILHPSQLFDVINSASSRILPI